MTGLLIVAIADGISQAVPLEEICEEGEVPFHSATWELAGIKLTTPFDRELE